MVEQAELRGTPIISPHGPPNAKGAASIAPQIAILCNRAFLVILVILGGKRAILVILASHFRTRMGLPKKVPLAVLLKLT